MNTNQAKNSALTTVRAFHYQTLIGIQKCFQMNAGQSVLFETAGDVSIVGENIADSIQIEVKDYTAPLTDHHENLWKTLSNWLDAGFDHAEYGLLVLHTTQGFGATTLLKEWEDKNAEGRLDILEQICKSRNFGAVTDPLTLTGVAKYQYQVMTQDSELLKTLLGKVCLHVDALDLDAVKSRFLKTLEGSIPLANQQSYLESLIGFVYEKSSSERWEIKKELFISHCEALTSQYARRVFTVPKLTIRDATDDELKDHSDSRFALKISAIDYDTVLPEAIGSWLELRNSLEKELDGFPKYRTTAHEYRDELKSIFSGKLRTARRKTGDIIKISQDLYDEFTGENPRSLEGYNAPSLVFKNGLIHDLMDDEELKLHWKVDENE